MQNYYSILKSQISLDNDLLFCKFFQNIFFKNPSCNARQKHNSMDTIYYLLISIAKSDTQRGEETERKNYHLMIKYQIGISNLTHYILGLERS